MAGAVELGFALALIGVAWVGWAAWTLGRAGDRLVDEGPYRFGRHPMYLGSVLMLFGLALALMQPALAAAALGCALLLDRYRIPLEEQRLRRAYGGWYTDYAASTRRWF
ncbi:MAG: isoprenylcysteine carboxylmethyltransferase family protein [Burkholderiales bacterium]|nr:isoprenylcysteine carboxylmethyltransferase family protein [Burkholderiales bacterium]